jgi:hypothetical protein
VDKNAQVLPLPLDLHCIDLYCGAFAAFDPFGKYGHRRFDPKLGGHDFRVFGFHVL